ncbi:hypothetical protein [Tautonia plasticadhaerens]|uniref:Glycosyltransferase RgtA/B/C/D-like domain-containing protein n=1 Tax=Tautonia plasticadhaerens TaxID=2527974 RepID=A0A518H7C1_9BACT|nr:hypothetical protein [Tautonia plasticadhaerens]QDV36750.1 hypothetical protein ElP_46790 [Tautonia plasticadhaerens]
MAARAAAVLGFYLAAVVGATWPFVTTISSRLPSTGDPLQHLWVMRWYKQCLLEGRSPLVCPELQYPVGAPIGNFSPLHLQSALYLITSAISANDVLCFNLIWLFGLLFTGMGTYVLARYVLSDDGAAALAGLLAMLSGPVIFHSHFHLELIFVGGFPLFQLAWMRFVDRPSFGRMLASAAGFVLVATCAAYFMVFAIFPAVLYLAWKASGQPRKEVFSWLGHRLAWSSGFALICLPVLMVLFSGQIWNVMQGQAGIRPRAEFDMYGAPWWAYLVPVPGQVLQGMLPLDLYGASGTSGEGVAYLGVVALLLVARAWFGGARFRDSGFWWSSAAMLAVLSLGSTLKYGSIQIPMPAGWLRDWDLFVPFRLIRVPARFKLFVPVCTGIIAGAAWMQIRSRWSSRTKRGAGYVAITLLVVFDLAQVPFPSEPLPDLPRGYAWIRDREPGAAWVDVPQMNSANAHAINSRYTYWQSLHGGRTTAGYSGHQNRPFDDLLSWNSPFLDSRMVEASFPGPPEAERYDLVRMAEFRDYVWLYLTHHDLRFVVLHRWTDGFSGLHVDRVADLLDDAMCYDDGELAIFDRELMDPPQSAVVLESDDWGGYYLLPRDGFVRLATRSSVVETYNPDPIEPLVFAFEAKAIGGTRRVTLYDGPTALWHWDVSPDAYRLQVSPPFLLGAGLGTLRLESDGVVELDRLKRRFEGESRPASMVVRGICLRPSLPGEREQAGVIAGNRGAADTPRR